MSPETPVIVSQDIFVLLDLDSFEDYLSHPYLLNFILKLYIKISNIKKLENSIVNPHVPLTQLQ